MSTMNVRSYSALKAIMDPWRGKEQEGASGAGDLSEDQPKQKIALVPTMGALHEGHLSLVRLAKKRADKVVVSIFVNNTQFGEGEDYSSYPRDLKQDIQLLQAEGVDLVYTPADEEIYPDGNYESEVQPGKAAEGLETAFRPHFFGGVVNVVYRLFEQIQPDIAVFGEKDYQQLQVIHELVAGNDLWIGIASGPVVRDEHGLALSSRNAYLSKAELEVARQFNVILRELGEGHKGALLAAGFDKVDYVEERWGRRLAAVWIGGTRLIDNVAVE